MSKFKYEDMGTHVVIYKSYKGSKMEHGTYEILVDHVTLDKLIQLNANVVLFVSGKGVPYAQYILPGKHYHYLHHLVLPVQEGVDVDHRNNSGLDNRACNLRYLPRHLNSRNSNRYKVGSSGYKWVSRNRNQYRASIKIKGKRHHIGNYPTPLEAHRAANSWVFHNFGSEFCTREAIRL